MNPSDSLPSGPMKLCYLLSINKAMAAMYSREADGDKWKREKNESEGGK